MKWFKMWTDARIDLKLKALTGDEFRVWFNLLCYVAEMDGFSGIISNIDDELLALEVSNNDIQLLNITLGKLKRYKIIEEEDGIIIFINWKKRQEKYPSDAPEKVKSRKKEQRTRAKREVSRECHENVTSKERARIDKNRSEEIRIEEEKKEIINNVFSLKDLDQETEKILNTLVVEFNTKYPENQRAHGIGGNIKTHDHFAERLQTGWTAEQIRQRMDLPWNNPAPWDIFDHHSHDDRSYGPGKKFKDVEEYEAWIKSMV